MKVLLVNGSPNGKGCTYTALCEVEKELNKQGIETEIFQLGKKPIRGCTACRKCSELGKCVFDDDLVNVRAGQGGAGGRICFRFSRALRGALGIHKIVPGPLLLCRRRPLCLQAGRGHRQLPPGRRRLGIRSAQQVFHHQQHAGRFIAVLEHGPWQLSQGSAAGSRRTADHEDAGAEHGLAFEINTSGSKSGSRSSGNRGAGLDKFHPLAVAFDETAIEVGVMVARFK